MKGSKLQSGMILLLAGLSVWGSRGVSAQQPLASTDKPLAAKATSQLPFPIVPMLIEYEYAPEYFAQWIGGASPYSMIEATKFPGAKPIFQLVLTDKATSERVYYSNSDAQVKSLISSGKKTVLTSIDFKVVENVAEQPAYNFAFNDEKGQAIRWRFVPLSPPNERGSGSTPGRRKGLGVAFRKFSTVADENTAIQIGGKVFQVEPWPQISTPPYFVAYRGVYGIGVQTGTLGTGSEAWRVTSAPTELKVGAQWVLTDERNNLRTLQITARNGDELTINETKLLGQFSTPLSLNARITPQGLVLRSVVMANESHLMRVTFKPDLNTAQSKSDVSFVIELDKNEKVMEGSISLEASGNVTNIRWRPSSPDWAKARTISTTLEVDAHGYKVATQ